MMVMTAKVNFKKILLGLAAVAALVLALILLLGGGKAEETSAPALRSNDGRVKFDLSQFAGKKVMRYVYKINNFPGSTEPVYATLLIYKNQVIGGDVTDSAPGGQIRALKMPEAAPKASVPVPSTVTPETTPSLAAK